MSELYVIRDSYNKIMHIAGITIFGVKTTIPAVFFSEQDALDILFSIESYELTNVIHTVSKVKDSFMEIME